MTHLDASLLDELVDAHFLALDHAMILARHQGRRELVVDPSKVWPKGDAPSQAMLEAMSESYKKKHFVVSWRMGGHKEPRLVLGLPDRSAAASLDSSTAPLDSSTAPRPLDSSTAPRPEHDEPVAEALVLPDDSPGEITVTDVDAWSTNADGELEFRARESDKPDDPQWKHWSCFCTWEAGDWVVTEALLKYVADIVPAKRRLAAATARLHKPLFPELLVGGRAPPPMEEAPTGVQTCGWRMRRDGPACNRVGMPIGRRGFSCAEHLCPVCKVRKRQRGCLRCGTCVDVPRRRLRDEMDASSSPDDEPAAKRARTE